MQANLEDQILQMLADATGSLLDNVELINTLDASKTTWEEVNEMLAHAEETSRKIEAAATQYRPCSVRAALLYFVLNDLARVDGMYQFSLDAYADLFALSIADAPKAEVLQERIRHLNDYHTYAVYKYTSRGLFERHKLLLSLQMAAKVWLLIAWTCCDVLSMHLGAYMNGTSSFQCTVEGSWSSCRLNRCTGKGLHHCS